MVKTMSECRDCANDCIATFTFRHRTRRLDKLGSDASSWYACCAASRLANTTSKHGALAEETSRTSSNEPYCCARSSTSAGVSSIRCERVGNVGIYGAWPGANAPRGLPIAMLSKLTISLGRHSEKRSVRSPRAGSKRRYELPNGLRRTPRTTAAAASSDGNSAKTHFSVPLCGSVMSLTRLTGPQRSRYVSSSFCRVPDGTVPAGRLA